ncbi:glycosyltransferase [Salibacteraceae bacterium]|nr:glycosyltransferase [Salibacteraceae bacterium]MDB9708439.1 glycosyltransferase [Salibacteraceae bacterium]
MTKPNTDSVLMIAAWWPTKAKPMAGLFIREHALAIAKHVEKVSIIHVSIEKQSSSFPFSIEIKQSNDNGLEIYHAHIKTAIRKFGIHDFLVKKAFSKLFVLASEEVRPLFFHLHVRDHISKLALETEVIKSLPYIHTEHFSFYHRGLDLMPAWQKNEEMKTLKNWFSNPKLKFFTPVSKELGNVVCNRFQLQKEKIVIIPNVVSPEFYFDENALDKNGKFRIVLAASWYDPKNPQLFFEALALLSPQFTVHLKIDIFGEGPELELSKTLIEGKLSHVDLNLRGFQSKTEIAQVMKVAHLFVHPTNRENLPTIIIEALCCGTPVLSMNVNGIPELIDDTNGILVEAKNVEALKTALETMISNNVFFDRKSIAQDAHDKFSPEVIGRKFHLLYQQISA